MVRYALSLLPVLSSAEDHPSGVVAADNKFQFSPVGDYCLVSFFGPASYDGLPKLESTGTITMEQCANLCRDSKDGACKTWTYVADASSDNACYDITSLNADAAGSVKLVYKDTATVKPITGLAGKCNCPSQVSPGMTLTGAEFPADNVDDYAKMFVNSGHQPAPLACWPKDATGNLKATTPVVQYSNRDPSAANYFQGWCDGLKEQTALAPGADCESACKADPGCTGFQLVPEDSAREPGCFWGAGYNCDADSSDAKGMIAERYERGYVNTIAKIKKFRVMGLKKRFDENAFTTGTPDPAPTPAPTTAAPTTAAPTTAAPTTAAPAATPAPTPAPTDGRRLAVTTDWAKSIKRCREICVADLWCTVWQVYDASAAATSTESGCFTEQRGDLEYPLDRSKMTPEEDGVILDGEFIQHWFSEDITTTTTTTTPPPPPNRLLPILLGLAGLAALLGLGAYAMGWCSPKEKTKKRKARGLQPAPEAPKEEPKVEPVPTQPSFLMSAPVLTYTAAPVTYAAPVATMQAAPVTYAAPPVTTASYQVVQPSSTVPFAQSTSVVVPQEPVAGGFMG